MAEMAYFIFRYFSTKLGTSVYGHEQIIPQEINGGEPILSKICITANVQENVISHYKILANLKFLTVDNIRFKKNQTFAIGPVDFAPGTQTYDYRTLKSWRTFFSKSVIGGVREGSCKEWMNTVSGG
jgi:hypothetical protein